MLEFDGGAEVAEEKRRWLHEQYMKPSLLDDIFYLVRLVRTLLSKVACKRTGNYK